MNYVFRVSKKAFWQNLHKLSPGLRARADDAWRIFKHDPFDSRLRPHKIRRLSEVSGRTIYAVEIAPDLRVVFYREGNVIYTVDIGTHDAYKNPG